MNLQEATSLAVFIKDHDTRFLPKAMERDGGACVLLKHPRSGKEEEVRTIEEYGERYIRTGSPGPTVEEAWLKWQGSR